MAIYYLNWKPASIFYKLLLYLKINKLILVIIRKKKKTSILRNTQILTIFTFLLNLYI